MAPKTKTFEAKETFEAAFKNGSESMKDAFEKMTAGFGDFASVNRENAEAIVKAANAAAKGFEQINSELLAFSRQSMEDGVAAVKTIMGSKSLQEAMEAQSDFTKSAFDAYVSQMSKVGELFVSATRDAIEPISGRVKATMEAIQAGRHAA